MPRLVHRNPKYCKHRASGQAVVTIDGQDIYLGPYSTRASRIEYDRVIAEWLAAGRRAPRQSGGLSVMELLAQFMAHAEQHYRKQDSEENTTELLNYKSALRPVKQLYGETSVNDFGPLALKAVRQRMIDQGLCRNVINRHISRIKHVFKWGVAEELVPAYVYQAVATLAGLQRGRSKARESERVTPVSDAMIDAVLLLVSPQVAGMIKLQRITGARPDEIASIRSTDIDMSKPLWMYKPQSHKTAHHGHERTIFFGKRCQGVIQPFLKPDLQAFIFSPIDAEADRLAKLHQERKTPLNQGNRPGSNRVSRPRRAKGNRYTVNSYRRAIQRACEIAFPPPIPLAQRENESRKQWRARLTKEQREELQQWRHTNSWHPHQLRHNAATEWRRRYGAETTLVLLGDRTTKMVDIYAEKNVEAARKIMSEVG